MTGKRPTLRSPKSQRPNIRQTRKPTSQQTSQETSLETILQPSEETTLQTRKPTTRPTIQQTRWQPSRQCSQQTTQHTSLQPSGQWKRQTILPSYRAELHFPVSRMARILREGQYSQRLNSATPVFLAGLLEYLTSNILELASKEAQDKGHKRITPQHVERVLEKNLSLCRLFQPRQGEEAGPSM